MTAVTASERKPSKHKHPEPTSHTEQVTWSASYSVAGGAVGTIALALNATGKLLLAQFYALPATAHFSAAPIPSQTLTFVYKRLIVGYSADWTNFAAYSVLKTMVLSSIPKGGSVVVDCRGGGCPFARRSMTPRGYQASVAGRLAGAHLAKGTVVWFGATEPNQVGTAIKFTIRGDEQPPGLSKDCLPPGATAPLRCAS